MNGKEPVAPNKLPFGLAEALRADAHRLAERDEFFWSRQRARILASSRMHRPRRNPLRIAFAGAVILLVAVLLTAPAGPPAPPALRPAAAAVDADQQLLIAVERALAAGTPQSLAPLSPFEQPNSNFSETQTIPHKEHRNED